MSNKVLSASFIVALAAGTVSVVAPTASAAPDGSNVVINEVYGGGGNSGAKYTHDFVELYNPTDQDIDVTGWVLDQQSSAGNSGSKVTLSGIVPAGGYFLIQGNRGESGSGDALPTPDQEAGFNFSAKAAIAVLSSDDREIDRVGWGSASNPEGNAAGGTTNGTSVQRKEVGKDTDNNADDFLVAEPTPQNSGSAGETPVAPAPENPTPQPGEVTPIAEIQGTGAASPLVGKTVITEGVVTAVYEEGGKNGFFLQAGGSGSEKHPGDASDGIFVYMGTNTNYPQRGESVRVSGQVGEHYTQTQITMTSMDTLDDALEAPKAVEIETLPAGDEAREPYEGMLVRPKGPYTVTNNYTLNTYGELGLAPGERAHRTPTDVVAPGAPAAELQAKQDAEVVYLDDGRTKDYFRTDKNTPLPYIVTSEGGVKSIRTGDQVDFQTDVVVDYSFDQWRFQPLEPITGKNAAEELPIAWEDSRGAAYDVPDTVDGDYSIGFFNVLNYFSSLGKDEQGCKAYNDINGQPVSANNCKVRGAFSQNAFQDQQAKIVTAINKLDTSVLGLSEIENTATVTGDLAKRDEALQNLVDALNAKEPGKWALVKSPQNLGTDEDFIRVAFIYQPAKVKPVGESIIFDDKAFTRTARQPLAQEFDTVGNDEDTNFVAVVNHFKSKGSVAQGDAATGDGQGNNANVRTRQSEALLKHLAEQNQWADLPTFLVGDFNAYTKEDAITKLVDGGFNIVESEKDYDQASYQFAGQLGTLDHVLANAAATELIQDSAVWNINGDEPVAFEYSRRNYNAQDFFGEGDDELYGYGNPFRSSDHDPVKVGFGIAPDEKDADKYAPEANEAVTVTQGDALPEAKSAIKDADALPDGTTFEWSKPANTDTVGENQEGEVTVTYPDKTTDTVNIVVNVKPQAEQEKPRFIVKAEIKDGDLVVTYDNGDTENLGKVTGEDGVDGKDGKDGEQGPKGDTGAQGPAGKDGQDGTDGKDGVNGADGRGVKAFEINDEGHLVVTYTDDEAADLGKVTGDATAGKNGVDGKDGRNGQDGRGVAEASVNEDGELVLTYTDGSTQNLGRVTDVEAGKDGADEKNGVNVRCLPAAGLISLPLLALVPLGLAATMDIPALAPVKEQIDKVATQLPVPAEVAGGAAGVALALAAIATLASVCSPEGGSSR